MNTDYIKAECLVIILGVNVFLMIFIQFIAFL